MIHDFFTLLESFREYDAPLIESIHEGMLAVFEARILPDIRMADPDEKLKHHVFKLKKDTPTSKVYKIATRGADKKLIGMLVQFIQIKPDRQTDQERELGTGWIINFVQDGQSDFNVTGTGSLDSFNSVFAVIKYFIENEHPDYVAFKATDADQSQASKKSRIYGGYFNLLGLTKVSPPDQSLEIYATT